MVVYRYSGFLLGSAVLTMAMTAAEARPAKCLLEVAGKVYIDGPCDHSLLHAGDDDFIMTGADGRFFAYVYVDGKRATAHWNGKAAERRAHDPLGKLTRDGACWIGEGVKLCTR